jgi:hypothetical protein
MNKQLSPFLQLPPLPTYQRSKFELLAPDLLVCCLHSEAFSFSKRPMPWCCVLSSKLAPLQCHQFPEKPFLKQIVRVINLRVVSLTQSAAEWRSYLGGYNTHSSLWNNHEMVLLPWVLRVPSWFSCLSCLQVRSRSSDGLPKTDWI